MGDSSSDRDSESDNPSEVNSQNTQASATQALQLPDIQNVKNKVVLKLKNASMKVIGIFFRGLDSWIGCKIIFDIDLGVVPVVVIPNLGVVCDVVLYVLSSLNVVLRVN